MMVFGDSRWLRVVIIRTGCRLRRNERLQKVRRFLVYESEDVKRSRRQVYLGMGGRNVLSRRWKDFFEMGFFFSEFS
jgi:hypothetical protein